VHQEQVDRAHGPLKPLLRIAGAIDQVNERVGKIVMWLVLLANVISAGNAVVRYGFRYSSNAWLEIQWYMFAAMFLVAAGYTLKHNQHVRVDLLYYRYSERVQAWVDLIGTVVFLIPTSIILVWLSLPMVENSYFAHEMSNDAGGLVRWPVKVLIPIGFMLLCLQAVSELIKRVAVLAGQYRMTEHYERPLQ
jgi:TRAP-type mannitol/chloroaromatic compound transport system permease small subunit